MTTATFSRCPCIPVLVNMFLSPHDCCSCSLRPSRKSPFIQGICHVDEWNDQESPRTAILRVQKIVQDLGTNSDHLLQGISEDVFLLLGQLLKEMPPKLVRLRFGELGNGVGEDVLRGFTEKMGWWFPGEGAKLRRPREWGKRRGSDGKWNGSEWCWEKVGFGWRREK